MKISEIKAGTKKIDVEGIILNKPDARTVNKQAGGTARTAEVGLADDSGEVKLVLWDGEIDSVSLGDRVKIENGYSTLYKGVTQLAVGKYGKLAVVGDKSATPASVKSDDVALKDLAARVAALEKTVFG